MTESSCMGLLSARPACANKPKFESDLGLMTVLDYLMQPRADPVYRWLRETIGSTAAAVAA